MENKKVFENYYFRKIDDPTVKHKQSNGLFYLIFSSHSCQGDFTQQSCYSVPPD